MAKTTVVTTLADEAVTTFELIRLTPYDQWQPPPYFDSESSLRCNIILVK